LPISSISFLHHLVSTFKCELIKWEQYTGKTNQLTTIILARHGTNNHPIKEGHIMIIAECMNPLKNALGGVPITVLHSTDAHRVANAQHNRDGSSFQPFINLIIFLILIQSFAQPLGVGGNIMMVAVFEDTHTKEG
jgi:hypothetical protein